MIQNAGCIRTMGARQDKGFNMDKPVRRLSCTRLWAVWLTPLTLCFAQAYASSEANAQEAWHFKLTPSYYQTTQEASATDVNLRANKDMHALWIGQYDQSHAFHQTRAGYEYTLSTGWGQLVPSIQSATGGFWGGALNVQWGQSTYLIAGLGRTNARPYYNLNFDPNDAITLGLGTWLSPEHQWTLWRTQDDRLQTGQRVTHLMWRYHLSNGNRLTMDAAAKKGRSDSASEVVKGNSLSVTWDWSTYFLRFASDQKVNFSDHDQKRVSLGWHF
jgi:hypothetical protein